jgi:DNA-binding MarR family transcriptional regulator
VARSPSKSLSLEAEVFLTLLHAADSLLRPAEETLKTAGLSHTQYNVLRILRGARRSMQKSSDAAGLPCGEIAARMITRDPDITRLLDRLESRGLVSRTREKKDRRVVLACITDAGLQLLRALDKPVAEMQKKLFHRVPAKNLRRLLEHLKDVRGATAQAQACAGDDAEGDPSA